MINNKFFVKGISMFPLIKENSHVIIKYTNMINTGDIIIFKFKDNKKAVHRVIKINKKIITKGDNNYFFDKPILKSKIIAKVTKINNKDVNLYNNKLIAKISYLEGLINSKNKLIHKIFQKLIILFN